MRVSGRLLFSLAIVLLAAWALLETRGWSIKTALYPRAVTIPLLLLAAAEALLSRKAGDAPESPQAVDFTMSSTVAPDLAMRRTTGLVAWIGGFFLSIILLGFQVAVPLFVFAYIKMQGKEGWLIAVALAFLAGLVFHLLFVSLLHLPLPAGLLWRVFGR